MAKLYEASGYLIGGMMAAIEMNSTGHFMDDGDDDDDVDDIGGCTDDSGTNCGEGTGDDDDKYSYPLYMITFPFL